jgi:methionyl-tRNA formyltransferase
VRRVTTRCEPVRVLFGGDREVSARLVEVIRSGGGEIVGLGLNSPPRPGGGTVKAVAGVDDSMVFYGRSFGSSVALRRFDRAQPHLGVCCGFAPILSPDVLRLPRWGWVNVHRSYLPYNRGLDPLQWALVDGTPAGVTIHVMTEAVDAGPIVAQREMPLLPTDNFDSLETRSDALVLDLFRAAWPRLRAGDVAGVPQDEDLATYHTWDDCKALRRLDLNATMKVGRVVDILRAYSSGDFSLVEFQVGLGPTPFRARMTVLPMVERQPHPSNGPGQPAGAGAASADDRRRRP